MLDPPSSIYGIEDCMEGIGKLEPPDCKEGIGKLGPLDYMEGIEKYVGCGVLGCIIGIYPGGIIKVVAYMDHKHYSILQSMTDEGQEDLLRFFLF